MRLRYVGEDPNSRFVPGWPAADHDEGSAAVARQKLKSGLYVESTGKEPAEQGKGAPAASQRVTEASTEEES